MALRNLKELLKEDQEPFHLQDYIADRKCQLNKKNQQQLPKTHLIHLKKSRPISRNSSFLCKNSCFSSIQESPLFDFTSPVKSPNRVFFHVPSKTASLLLESAMKIQNQSKPKSQMKNLGFGIFGSMLKRLTNRSRTQKLKGMKTEDRENNGERFDQNEMILVVMEDKDNNNNKPVNSTCSSSSSSSSISCNGRISSLDLESSSSGRSFDDDEEDEDENNGFVFDNGVREINGDYGLCLSPLSPFRFALHRSPSPDRRSSVFSSPAKFEDNVRCEEEDKEQNSPVSVLDPPFEDDFDGQDEDSYHLESSSCAFVQRARKDLLQKLHRFEKLAELDPIELEKKMIEEEDNDDEELIEDYEDYDYESFTFDDQRQIDEFIEKMITKSGFRDIKKPGIKRLVSDVMIEEENNASDGDEQLIKRVCKRLESWSEVESNTIDMMVEIDLRREIVECKKPHEQIDEVAKDIQVAIFGVLVEELIEDLAYSTPSC